MIRLINMANLNILAGEVNNAFLSSVSPYVTPGENIFSDSDGNFKVFGLWRTDINIEK